jgi:hypothetical protein
MKGVGCRVIKAKGDNVLVYEEFNGNESGFLCVVNKASPFFASLPDLCSPFSLCFAFILKIIERVFGF